MVQSHSITLRFSFLTKLSRCANRPAQEKVRLNHFVDQENVNVKRENESIREFL